MSSWNSYPKVWNLGHKYVVELLKDEVLVEEKVDGSQFSFGLFPNKDTGAIELRFRSHHCDVNPNEPGMFKDAVDWIQRVSDKMTPGLTYRGEALSKPKHNALAYDRVPAHGVVLFDINDEQESYLSYEAVFTEAKKLDLEIVPRLFSGMITGVEQVNAMLDTTSFLGGQKIEGVVIKNYKRYGIDGHALMGKFVSEAFKEIHKKSWGDMNPSQGDITQRLVLKYKTEARWQKALIHLKEKGLIEDDPKDIGPLFKEVSTDMLAECADEIKDALFEWAWKKINRGVSAGLAEWYKAGLLKKQFGEEVPSDTNDLKCGEVTSPESIVASGGPL